MAKRPMTELDVDEARALVRDGRANHSVNGCFVNGHGIDHRCWWCRRVDDKPWSQVAQAVLTATQAEGDELGYWQEERAELRRQRDESLRAVEEARALVHVLVTSAGCS
jgi:hypothetical protein